MKQKRILQDDEIDLREIIETLWNKKILILSISLIFMVVGYVYGRLQPQIYKTEITIRNAPSYLFDVYVPFIKLQQQQPQLQLQLQLQQQKTIAEEFNDNLKLNLSSLDFLVKFVENNNKISNFKNHLKEKNTSERNYFNGKFNSVIDKNKNITNKFFLIYTEPLAGETFLNDYIIFAQQQALISFKKQLIQSINNEIDLFQQHLEIAEKIDLKNPILQSSGDIRVVLSEPNALFYKGTKVLSQRLNYLNKLLNETKNFTLDYDPILQSASSSLVVNISPKIYGTFSFFLGLFFSLILIFKRPILFR
jgi:LPS O-antigen subunit length determinant protein (WzzB/FepE family)